MPVTPCYAIMPGATRYDDVTCRHYAASADIITLMFAILLFHAPLYVITLRRFHADTLYLLILMFSITITH